MGLDRRTAGLASALGLLAVAAALASTASPLSASAPGEVLLVEIEGGIGPATRDHVLRGLDRAAARAAPAVVLRIDTPGGLDAATRDINRAILAAKVPVIAWVAPEGARAASAGTYIVYASHLAAMAPATSLGAATPVSLGGPMPGGGPAPRPDRDEGKDGANNEGDRGNDKSDRPGRTPSGGEDSASTRKAVNDSAAYLRSLAELRGRDVDFAEAAVRDAATLTASQALARNVVEIVADDVDSLLRQADGRRVMLGTQPHVLAVAGRTVTTFAPDWRTRALAVLTEPTVAYLLLLVGLYGLLFEGYSPGAIVPGVVGAICLLLALYALQVLPVNYAGVALIVLGVALMTVEVAMPSFGALGIGGLVALLVGSVILFDGDVPGFGVPRPLIVSIGIASGLAFMGIVWLAARARKRPVVSGVEDMFGEAAVAITDFEGRGRVRVHGEIWQAASDVPVRRGQSLRVLAMDGLVLRVTPAVEQARRNNGGKP